MTEIKCEQMSVEWFTHRLGKITGSKLQKLMPTKKQKIDQWNDTQLSILRECVAERLTGEREETFTNKAMQWGIDHESFARDALSTAINMPIRDSGFWKYSDYIGVSPDGIVGFNEAVCELKCPMSKQHVRYMLDIDELFKDYEWQIKVEMYGTGIHNNYYASYDPRFPDDKMLSYSSYTLTQEDIDMLDNRLNLAVEFIKEWTGDSPIDIEL
jgi:hypothetical protein